MSNDIKRLIGYIIYVAAFGFLIIMAEQLGNYYQEIFKRAFQIPYWWVFFALIGFPILIGAYLALPQFINTVRQQGSWKVDWIRLITLGLPGLLIALVAFFGLMAPDLIAKSKIFIILWGYHQTLIKVAGLLLGFVLLNSLYKQS